MARSKVLDLSSYPDGFYEFGPANINNNVTQLGAEIDRCTTADPTIWPNESTTVRLGVQYSLDGGTTWSSEITTTAVGGIYVVPRTGLELAATEFSVPIPDGTNRLVKGSMTITGGPLRSTIYIHTN